MATTTGGTPRSRRPGGAQERERREKVVAAAKAKQTAAQQPPPAIRTVADLEKILPNMPQKEQQRIRALIAEYGDGLNEYLAQSVDMSSAGTLEDADGTNSLTGQGTFNDYETAIGVLTQMVENVMEQENEGTPVDNDTYVKLWSTVKLFSKIQPDQSIEPPLQVLVILFQLAKAQQSGKARRLAIKSVGDLLYGYQLVRLDPFNEVEYLSALTKSRNIGKAIKIWESRRSKEDVKGSIWWLEVGACLYQEAHDLSKAENLAEELRRDFDYVPPKVATRFIRSYLGMRDAGKAWEWYKYMITSVRNAGGPGEPETVTGDLDPEEAEAIFNRKHVPSEDDLVYVLDMFLKGLHSSYSVIIINDLSELGIKIPLETILTNLETVAKNIVRLEDPQANELLSVSQPEDQIKPKRKEDLLTNVIQSLSEANPKLLESKRFYNIWISALANMNQLESALDVLDSMLERNLSPPPITYHTVLKNLLLQGRVEFAFQILEYMETNGASGSTSERALKRPAGVKIPSPLSMHYALFIQYGARRSKHSFVLNILNRMAEHGVRHDQSTYLALFYYRYRSRDFLGFFRLLNEAINTNKQQFSSEGYRVIWTITRDYYRSPSLVKHADDVNIDLRSLFVRMLQSKDFKPLMEVYEPALQALLRANAIPEVFAALLYLGNHNGVELDPLVCFRLTRTAQKTAKENAREGMSQTQPRALTANEVSLDRAMNSIMAGGGKVPSEMAKLKIKPEVLIEALCMYLKVDYTDYLTETEDVLQQFLLAEQK